MILQTTFEDSGFPAGYFVMRSVATNRLLDVTMDDLDDGTEISLWSEKEKSLVESKLRFSIRAGFCHTK